MILEIRGMDAEARKQAEYATKVAESNERDFMYRAGTFEKEVSARLDSFGMGLQFRGKQIKEVSDLLGQTRNFIIDELTKVTPAPAPRAIAPQNTDFAAQFAQSLAHNDREVANVAGAQRQTYHRLSLVEGQLNALALGVPTKSGEVLQTNVTAAQHDIVKLRQDLGNLEKQFAEMRQAIGEAILTKTPEVKESERVQHRFEALEGRLNSQTIIIQRQEEELKKLRTDAAGWHEALRVMIPKSRAPRKKTPK